MPIVATMLDIGALVARELALFAACGFLVLGVGDLIVDAIWIGLRIRRLLTGRRSAIVLHDLPPPQRPGRLIVFIPAWDESAVIEPMLRHALRTLRHDDYRLYVGCYPNDPATSAAVGRIGDGRIRLVTNARPGPTSKADCLNQLWAALLQDEVREGFRAKAIILHDAEDVVHSAKLAVFDSVIERFALVQLPVLPLIDRRAQIGLSHYCEEFAEAHGKEMIVREALGAGLPSAGVGCAIARDALAGLADADGRPFDADSLTEDYEAGLRLRASGWRGTFAHVRAPGGGIVCTRSHFPETWRGAVAQKSRWIAGIALSGWDRLGWQGGFAERWMRLRDRQALLAALLLCVAYAALLLTPIIASLGQAVGHQVVVLTPTLTVLTTAATMLFAWRLVMRFTFATRFYGPVEGLKAIPRVIVSNAIAMLAARKALGRYRQARRTGVFEWGKTAHIFPDSVPAE